MEQKYNIVIPEQEVEDLKTLGLAVDASCGGLVLGPSMDKGGIMCLAKQENGYVPLFHYGEIFSAEGQMFIMNHKAMTRFRKILDGLNNFHLDSGIPGYPVNGYEPRSPILNCHVYDRKSMQLLELMKIGKTKVLLFDVEQPCFFVNKYSAWRHLELLDWMNCEEPQQQTPLTPALPWWKRWLLFK